MAGWRVERLTSAEQLRASAPAWDDLWWRSDVALPSVRAEAIALWLDAFAPNTNCCALTVEHDGRLLAALPLIGGRMRGVLPIGRLIGNAWCQAGDLLLDQAAGVPVEIVLDHLAAALDDVPWPLLCFEQAPLETDRWRALASALRRRGMRTATRVAYRVGQVVLPADWSELEAGWSRNHRHKMRRLLTKLARDGGHALVRPTTFDPDEAARLLRQACEIEDRGWKGAAGTSVLRTPAALAFYDRLARMTAQWNQFDIAFLNVAGQAIAFSYGFRAKGTAFAAKVGYDERHAAYSPGHVLIHSLLRAYHAEGDPAVLDLVGPLVDWTSRWANRDYAVGRLLVAPNRPLGRGLLRAYSNWWPKLSGWLRRPMLSNEDAVTEDAAAADASTPHVGQVGGR